LFGSKSGAPQLSLQAWLEQANAHMAVDQQTASSWQPAKDPQHRVALHTAVLQGSPCSLRHAAACAEARVPPLGAAPELLPLEPLLLPLLGPPLLLPLELLLLGLPSRLLLTQMRLKQESPALQVPFE
jgi:hypothetical protein